MKKQDVIEKCAEYGEFYIYYNKLKDKGSTYLQGTTDFSDKYLSKLPKPYRPDNENDNMILVFSRTNDCFRYIPVDKIRRITSLESELDKATPINGRTRKYQPEL